MGAGTTQVRNYRMKNGFYKAKDFDRKLGGTFWFIIEPLHGCENERFFYVKELEDGNYHLHGEGHVLYKPEHLADHLKELRKELEGVIIHYFFINDEGRVIRKEVSDKPVTHSA